MRLSLRAALVMAIIWAAVPATKAQTAAGGSRTEQTPIGAATPGPAGGLLGAGPIAGGKHLQPKGTPDVGSAPDVDQLLKAEQYSPASRQPTVVPRDLYGQPMGGDPGTQPLPDPDSHHEAAPTP